MTASGRNSPREFGDALRRARAAAGVSLEDISERTKISMRVLRALEAGEYRAMPSRVFARNFVRQILERIGESPDGWMTAFDEAWERFATASQPSIPVVPAPARRRRVGPWLVGMGLVAVAIGALIMVDRRQHPAEENLRSTTPAALLPVLAPTPEPTGMTMAVSSPVPGGEPAAAATPVASPMPEVSATATELVIRARGGSCWVKAAIVKGPSASRLLHAGETWIVPAAGRAVDLVLGDAGAVALSYLGETRDPAGPPGEVLRVRLGPAASPTMLTPVPGTAGASTSQSP